MPKAKRELYLAFSKVGALLRLSGAAGWELVLQARSAGGGGNSSQH